MLGLWLVRWPLGWTGGSALALLGLLGFAPARAAWRAAPGKTLDRGATSRGLLVPPAVTVVAACGAAVAALILRTPGVLAANWPAHPLPLLAACWLGSLLVSAALAGRLCRLSSLLEIWSGLWIGWAVVAVILAWTLPEMGYLFLVPAAVASICSLLPG